MSAFRRGQARVVLALQGMKQRPIEAPRGTVWMVILNIEWRDIL